MINKIKHLILLTCLALPCLVVLLIFLSRQIDETAWVSSVDFSPDGKTLVVGRYRAGMAEDHPIRFTAPGSVVLYDVETQRFRHLLVSFSSPATYEPGINVSYSKEGKRIIVHDPDSTYRGFPSVYDAQSLQPLPKSEAVTYKGERSLAENEFHNFSKSRSASSLKAEITSNRLAYNPDNRLLAAGSYDLQATVIKPSKNGGQVTTIEPASNRGQMTVIERANNNKARHYPFPIGQDTAFMEWLPKSSILWVGDYDGRYIFWDYNQRKFVADVKLKIRVTCVAVNRARDAIAFGREDGSFGIVAVKDLHQALKDGTFQQLLNR